MGSNHPPEKTVQRIFHSYLIRIFLAIAFVLCLFSIIPSATSVWDKLISGSGMLAIVVGLAAWDRESRAFRFRGFYSGGVLSYVWGKLYRRSFLVNNGIRFPELSYAEDKVFSIHCYFCHASYAFAEGAVYAYRKNPSSVSFRYQPDFFSQWMMAARQMGEDLQSAGENAAYEDLVWYCIVFAVFFCGKMEYEEKQRSQKAVRDVLQKFGEDPLAVRAFAAVSSREGVRGIDQRSWRWMLRGFSFAMKHHWYRALSAGIGLLVDRRVDEKLSDTGRRE